MVSSIIHAIINYDTTNIILLVSHVAAYVVVKIVYSRENQIAILKVIPSSCIVIAVHVVKGHSLHSMPRSQR